MIGDLVQYLVQALIAASPLIWPVILQALKNWKYFPLLNAWSSKAWKVTVAALTAAASACGITYSFDPAVGDMLIHGLTWTSVGHAIGAFILAFVTQHLVYEKVVRKAMPDGRGR